MKPSSRSRLLKRARRVPTLVSQKGLSMFELVLGLSAAAVLALGVYSVFLTPNVSAEVHSAEENLGVLSSNIDRSFGLGEGFESVSLNGVVAQGLLPKQYRKGGVVQSEWGQGIDVRANTVSRSNDSYVIDLSNVPTDACEKLAVAMAPKVYDLRISGSTVFSFTGLDKAAAASQCNRSGGAQMEFVYYSSVGGGSAVAAQGSPSTPPPGTEPPVQE